MIHEDEAEQASNAYLLSLVLLAGGIGLPLLNLIASVIFYLGSRKDSAFVRWHCVQAMLGQLLLIPINSTFVWMTLEIAFSDREIDNFYIGWGLFMVTVNIAEVIGSIYAAIRVKKGHEVRWWSVAPLTDALMQRGPLSAALTTVAVWALVITGTVTTLTRVEWTRHFSVPEAEDRLAKQVGKVVDEVLAANGSEIDDARVAAPVKRVFDRVCKAAAAECGEYQIHLINSMDVNAAALPDQRILVNAGLILKARSPEAFAGVIAHEIAHSERNHVRRKLLRDIGLTAIMGSSAENGAALLKEMTSLSYDRDLEREADTSAVAWLVKAQIDPHPFADLMAGLGDAGNFAMLSSHPGSEARAQAILDLIPEDHKPWQPVISPAEWARLQAELRDVVTGLNRPNAGR